MVAFSILTFQGISEIRDARGLREKVYSGIGLGLK